MVYLVFDLTSYESFAEIITYWVNLIEEKVPLGIRMMLLGNKCDLVADRQVKEAEIMEFCEKKGIPYVSCSAKKNINIEEVFERFLWA